MSCSLLLRKMPDMIIISAEREHTILYQVPQEDNAFKLKTVAICLIRKPYRWLLIILMSSWDTKEKDHRKSAHPFTFNRQIKQFSFQLKLVKQVKGSSAKPRSRGVIIHRGTCRQLVMLAGPIGSVCLFLQLSESTKAFTVLDGLIAYVKPWLVSVVRLSSCHPLFTSINLWELRSNWLGLYTASLRRSEQGTGCFLIAPSSACHLGTSTDWTIE